MNISEQSTIVVGRLRLKFHLIVVQYVSHIDNVHSMFTLYSSR